MTYPIRVPLSIQWGDQDALGHVNNAKYFTWFESARIVLFEAVALAADRPGLSVGPILATISCDFLEPLHYPGRIEVCAAVRRIGNTSFVVAHGVMKDGRVVARGDGVVVLVNYETGAKVPIPDDMRRGLEGLQIAE